MYRYPNSTDFTLIGHLVAIEQILAVIANKTDIVVEVDDLRHSFPSSICNQFPDEVNRKHIRDGWEAAFANISHGDNLSI